MEVLDAVNAKWRVPRGPPFSHQGRYKSMADAGATARGRSPWLTFVGGFLFLYLVIAVVLMLGGVGAGQAWGTPAAVLIGPALGMGVVRYRKWR